jgi:hypothetical protein
VVEVELVAGPVRQAFVVEVGQWLPYAGEGRRRLKHGAVGVAEGEPAVVGGDREPVVVDEVMVGFAA